MSQKPQSDIYVIGPSLPSYFGLEFDFLHEHEILSEMDLPQNTPCFVVDANELSEQRTEQILSWIDLRSNTSQVILIDRRVGPSEKVSLVNDHKVYGFCPEVSEDTTRLLALKALEKHRLEQQDRDLVQLIANQNDELRRLQAELDDRILKRSESLKQSQRRLETSQQRIKALHECLIRIQQATSVSEMERFINDILTEFFAVEWVRIVFHGQDFLLEQLQKAKAISEILVLDLTYSQRDFGWLVISRKKNSRFRTDEKQFLRQIADVLPLSVMRLTKLEQTETLKQQWEATFDALSFPVALTHSTFKLARMNRAFFRALGLEVSSDLVSKNVFETFLGKKIRLRAEDLPIRKEVSITRGETQFDYQVHVLQIQKSLDRDISFVMMFHDITEQNRLQRRLLESSKMAELGTISSSIAHELNNPMGGMLNFIQLIKMDLDSKNDMYSDVEEMENAAHRCKEIVENLLGFSRLGRLEHEKSLDLREILKQAVKISELQTRSRNIHVEYDFPDEDCPIEGQFNYLSQAFQNILQNSVESIMARLSQDPHYDGQIRIELKPRNNQYLLTISDNGIGMSESVKTKAFNPLFSTKPNPPHAGLGLTVSYQIVEEHKGSLELYSQAEVGTSAKITLLKAL